MTKLTIDGNGRLALPYPAVREIGSRPLELVSHSGQHLFLTVSDEGCGVSLAGLLGEVAVADLLSFFNMFRKTGILRFTLSGGNKDLYFQQGEIVFAASTFPEEELGEILCDLGKVGRDTLQKVRQFITARTTLGKFLVVKGMVTPRDLWLATRYQVETIVYSIFAFHQGSYSFLVKALEKGKVVRLSMSTQNLIMEGLRRVDERALFMRRIRSMDVIPVLTGKKTKELNPAEQRMALLVGGKKGDVREVLRKSGMGEFDGLRILYQLVEKGVVRMEDAPTVAVEGEFGEILSVFNSALAALYRHVAEKKPDFGQEIRCFLRDLPHPFSYVFRDASLRENGALDGGRILANLAGLEEEDKKKLLADALSELVYMECIAARRELGAVKSAELVRRVQEISRRMKNLIGRTQ